MARYDIEQYIDDFIVKLKAELNTKITAINTDKGDSLLSTIGNDSYYFGKASPKRKADKVFFYYEAYDTVDIETDQRMRGLVNPVKTYVMEMGIAFGNNVRYSDTDVNNFKRIMRYQKAFEEALLCVNNKLRGYGQLTINQIQSSQVQRNDNLLHVSAFFVEITLGG